MFNLYPGDLSDSFFELLLCGCDDLNMVSFDSDMVAFLLGDGQ